MIMKKIIALVKKYRLIVLVSGLIVLLSVLTLKSRPKKSLNVQPSPTPQNQSINPLLLIHKDPPLETISSLWSVEPITFTFNKNIRPDTIKYSISPNIVTKIKFESTTPAQFTIIPLTGWAVDKKYTIIISSVEAATGEKLSGPIQTSITRIFDPKDIPDIVY